MKKMLILSGLCVVALAVFLLIGGSPFVSVQRGNIGVKVRFGQVVGKHLNPGLRFKVPIFERIDQVDVRQRNATEHSEAASKDLQKINTDVKVLYALNKSLMPIAYDRIGRPEDIENVLIEPAIKECFKAVTAEYTAEQLVTKRGEVSQKIEKVLTTFIERSCEHENLAGLIRVDNVSIQEFKFSNEFDNSIEAKMVAEQEALRAQEQKNRLVTEAEAAKEQARLQSEAEAIRIENEAKAQAFRIESESIARAEAIKREAEALKGNPSLIELRKIEQWNGQLPRFNGGGVMPFVNAESLIQE